AAVDNPIRLQFHDLIHREPAHEFATLTDLAVTLHGRVELLLVHTHRDDIVAHFVQQRHIAEDPDEKRRFHPAADQVDEQFTQLRVPEHIHHREIDGEMAGFVGIDPPECFLADRVFDLVHDELHQGTV